MMHPMHAVVVALGARNPAHAAYQQLQRSGSDWSRWTGHGNRAVQYAQEAAAAFLAGRNAEDAPSLRICCAGCNDGLEMDAFARVGFQVEGFDIDPEKVRVAQYCGHIAKVGDIHDPPFSSNIYEGVFCSHTFEHCLDREKAAKALMALLKPGGLLFLAVPLEPAFPVHNPAHTGWVASREQAQSYFPDAALIKWTELKNPDLECILVLRKA